MYCIGGICCEKVSVYYLYRGFKKVYMIDGGIIEYVWQCDQKGLLKKFIGKNFVFDECMGECIINDVIFCCYQCGVFCDMYVNCVNDVCYILFIQCLACVEKYDVCCLKVCNDFKVLFEVEQEVLKGKVEFNGIKFGKGWYKVLCKDELLDVS